MLAALYDIDDEVGIAGLGSDLGAIVDAIREEMLNTGTSLSDADENGLSAPAARNVSVVRLTISYGRGCRQPCAHLRPTTSFFG